jgi:hypothetical protein
MSGTHALKRHTTRNRALFAAVLAAASAAGLALAPAPQASAATTGLISADEFNRANSSALGKAATGGAYAFTGQSNAFVLSDSKAVAKNVKPGKSAEAYLPGVSVADVLVQDTLTVPVVSSSALSLHHTLEARRLKDGSTYRGRLQLGHNGTVTLAISRKKGTGAETSFGSVKIPLTVSAAQDVNFQFQVTGNNPVALQVRAWVAGSAVPDWQYVAKDTSSGRITAAGAVGIWDYVGRSSTTMSIAHDNFTAYNPANAPVVEPAALPADTDVAAPVDTAAPATPAPAAAAPAAAAPPTTTPASPPAPATSTAPTSTPAPPTSSTPTTSASKPASSTPTATKPATSTPTTSAPAPTTTTKAPAVAPAAAAPVVKPAAPITGTVIRNATFDNMPNGAVVPTNFINALGSTNKNQSAYDDMSIIDDGRGGKAVRTILKANTIHSKPGGDNGNNLFVSLPKNYDKACISYDIRFDSNFEWAYGGKLPGLEGVAPGVSPSTPSGGNSTTQGWSGRMMWLGPGSYSWAGPTNMAVSYMYHPGQSSQYGDNVKFNKPFVAGTWHTIKQCYTMNTVGKSDGILQGWMDGQQTVNFNNYVYRTRSDVHISHLMFSLFRGGGTMDWASKRNGYVDIDNMVITTS